jgi:hypothetical protein
MASMVAIVLTNWKYWIGGTMPQIESFQESVQHCFDVAKLSLLLEEDVALEAFELLTTNKYDEILAHALGVSL